MVRTPWVLITAGVLCAAVFPFDVMRSVLATTAATLFEALPFLIAGRMFKLPAWAGCGCGNGPAARSLPALCATWLAFDPITALSRFIAAVVLGNLFHSKHSHFDDAQENILSDLAAIVPYGIVAGIIAHLLPLLIALPHSTSPPIAFCIGSALGFLLAPCGLGVIGIAGAFHAYTPAASLGFLCTAGVCDLRTLMHLPKPRIANDSAAYVLLAFACAFVAWQHGATLVHPRFVFALWICAALLVYLMWRSRSAKSTSSFYALAIPSIMLAATLLGAPTPTYQATATTLTDAFPGEHVTFTGVVTRADNTTTVVRYAITCCRADAIPVSVRLARDIPVASGCWAEVSGTFGLKDSNLTLTITRFAPLPAPGDPFIYR